MAMNDRVKNFFLPHEAYILVGTGERDQKYNISM